MKMYFKLKGIIDAAKERFAEKLYEEDGNAFVEHLGIIIICVALAGVVFTFIVRTFAPGLLTDMGEKVREILSLS